MSDWPALSRDLEILEEEVEKHRTEFKENAARNKNWFLASQITVVVLNLILVGIGAALTVSGESYRALAAAQIIASFIAAAIVLINREMAWQKHWLHQRVASESLKREHYLFLGRVERYADVDEPIRLQLLRNRVREIENQCERELAR